MTTKEDYFGAGKLETQAEKFLDSVSHFRARREPPVELVPHTAALLVTDMQDYFLDPHSHAYIPSAAAVIPQIEKLQQAFGQKSLPVVWTRHVNDSRNAGRMAQWWREMITAANPLSRISPRIQPLEHPGATVMIKSQYDAFFNTSLEEELKGRGVTQVVITGVMTHLCCETTARSAFMRGFEVFFVIDAVADYNRQFHQAALLNLAHGFAVPVLTWEILDEVNR
ncbi:MAG: isochorismatase family protein [bacterium]|nr:isochorismatase family protein [bacterium]